MWKAVRLGPTFAVLSLLLVASTAEAQLTFVARKATGKIRTMTQKQATGSPGYSVAEVILTGDADRVYARALKAAETSTEARLTDKDASDRSLEFEARGQVFGMRISPVDGKRVHMLIVTTVPPGRPDATASVVEAALRVCEQMKVPCERTR